MHIKNSVRLSKLHKNVLFWVNYFFKLCEEPISSVTTRMLSSDTCTILTDLFSECYSNSEDRAYSLLVRKTRCWSKATVLNLATVADAKCFFAHDGVQVTAYA